jgi:hypothetical protein
MKTNLIELYKTNLAKACKLALARTVRLPDRGNANTEEQRIEAINRLLGTFGTEAIRGDWQNGYWGDIVAVYCNTGETYALTVIQLRGDWSGAHSRFFVSSVGDFVERNEKLYGLI